MPAINHRLLVAPSLDNSLPVDLMEDLDVMKREPVALKEQNVSVSRCIDKFR
jgi:hypothetical protein